jgi:hypothetical protein
VDVADQRPLAGLTREIRRSEATISSTVALVIAAGEVPGRRDRGSNAASPSAWYRASSV